MEHAEKLKLDNHFKQIDGISINYFQEVLQNDNEESNNTIKDEKEAVKLYQKYKNIRIEVMKTILEQF